jgi:hypothetical protein
MKVAFHYFERDSFVGSRDVQLEARDAEGRLFYPFCPNTAYFCPQCGELWGRQVQDGETEYSSRGWPSWTIERRPCVEHGDGQMLFAQPLDGASPELLTRELLALIEGVSHEHSY